MDFPGFVPVTALSITFPPGGTVEPAIDCLPADMSEFAEWDYRVLDILSTTSDYRVGLN